MNAFDAVTKETPIVLDCCTQCFEHSVLPPLDLLVGTKVITHSMRVRVAVSLSHRVSHN